MVLQTLAPAERIALVLHDMFTVPFAEIAPIVRRSPAAAKKLAGRARHKVLGGTDVPGADVMQHRRVIDAFLAAIRSGDMDALLAVLDTNVVRRADRAALPPGAATEVRGARKVIEEARVFSVRARVAEPALIDGTLGAIVAQHGQLILALTFTISHGKVAEFEVIADPTRLHQLTLAVLDL